MRGLLCLSACLFVCPIITQEPLDRFPLKLGLGNSGVEILS